MDKVQLSYECTPLYHLPSLSGIYPGDEEGEWIALQWQDIARTVNVTDKFTAKRLLSSLLFLRTTDNPALKAQILQFHHKISDLTAEIEWKENDLNGLIFRLYGLDEGERGVVDV